MLLARELPSCPSSTKLRVPSSLPATTNRQIHVHYGSRGGQGSRRLRRAARRRGPDPITIARLDWTLAQETLGRVGDLDRSSPSLLPSCSQRPLRRGRLSTALVLVSLQTASLTDVHRSSVRPSLELGSVSLTICVPQFCRSVTWALLSHFDMHLYVYGPKALGRADKLAPRGCEPTGLSNRATLGRAEIAGIRTRTRASANDKPSQYRSAFYSSIAACPHGQYSLPEFTLSTCERIVRVALWVMSTTLTAQDNSRIFAVRVTAGGTVSPCRRVYALNAAQFDFPAPFYGHCLGQRATEPSAYDAPHGVFQPCRKMREGRVLAQLLAFIQPRRLYVFPVELCGGSADDDSE